MCAATAKPKHLLIVRDLRSQDYGLLEAFYENRIERRDLEMLVARDICVLVVLVNVGHFNHSLEMFISLPLYTMNRRIPRRLYPMRFGVAVPVDAHKDKKSEVYHDLSYISWLKRTLTCLWVTRRILFSILVRIPSD